MSRPRKARPRLTMPDVVLLRAPSQRSQWRDKRTAIWPGWIIRVQWSAGDVQLPPLAITVAASVRDDLYALVRPPTWAEDFSAGYLTQYGFQLVTSHWSPVVLVDNGRADASKLWFDESTPILSFG